MLDVLPADQPHSIEAEQAVLGAVLIDNAALDKLGALSADEFYDPVHRAMYAAMREQWATRRAVNAALLRPVLAGIPDIAPGVTPATYVRRLVENGDTRNVGAMADALRDYARRRLLCEAALSLYQSARTDAASVSETANIAVAVLDEVLSAARDRGPSRVDIGQAFSDLLDVVLNEDGSDEIVPTGLSTLDAVIGGWRRKQFAILAGRPSMGKSAVATSAMLRTAKQGHGVLCFSLEMAQTALAARCLSDLSWSTTRSIPYSDALSRRLTEAQAETWCRLAPQFKSLPLVIDDQRGLTCAEIAARSRAEAQRMERAGKRLSLVVVDHLGLVRPSGRYAGNKVHEVGEISDALATMAKELDVAVVALHQLNRGTEARDNKRPTMADLRNSGDLEQDADLIVFAYREAYYLERQKCDAGSQAEADRVAQLDACRNTLDLLIAKNRHGPTRAIPFFCDMACNVVRDLATGG